MSLAVGGRPRVLVLRTSRFAGVAVDRVTADWPGAEVVLVAPEGVRITISSLLTSTWGWQALSWRPDIVVVQWWNQLGRGHEAVDRAALLLQPRGFHVVMEDGGRVWVPAGQRLMRPLRVLARRLFGVAVIAGVMVATVVLWLPTVWRQRRERQRMKGTV